MKRNNRVFSEKLKRRIYNFIIELVGFIETLPKNDSLCKVVINQLLRSVTSIVANYVEAIAGSSKKDFTNFLSYSLKSANETKFWLALLRDAKKGDRNKINLFLDELIEISNIIGSSVRTLKGK